MTLNLKIIVSKFQSLTQGNCAKFSDVPCLGNSIAKHQDPWKWLSLKEKDKKAQGEWYKFNCIQIVHGGEVDGFVGG